MKYDIAELKNNTLLFDNIDIEEFIEWYEDTPAGQEWVERYGRDDAIARISQRLARLENTTFVKGGDEFQFEKYNFIFAI